MKQLKAVDSKGRITETSRTAQSTQAAMAIKDENTQESVTDVLTDRLNVVTGANGFTGKYITRILLGEGKTVKNFTNHPNRPDPFDGKVKAVSYNFDNPSLMVEELRGVHTVYNTYWVRFNYGLTTFGQAVANVQNLIRAAREAGVKRFVHTSIVNPDLESSSHYLKGKAQMEQTLIESGLSYAILRPTVLFGEEDILINNIAWLLRTFPVFAVPGLGDYRIQPVCVDDVARLAVEMGRRHDNIICDAVGPETYSFDGLVRHIKDVIGARSLILRLPPRVVTFLTAFVNPLLGDVIIDSTEASKISLDKLVSYSAPLCKTRFSTWIREHKDTVGRKYESEIKRHFK